MCVYLSYQKNFVGTEKRVRIIQVEQAIMFESSGFYRRKQKGQLLKWRDRDASIRIRENDARKQNRKQSGQPYNDNARMQTGRSTQLGATKSYKEQSTQEPPP